MPAPKPILDCAAVKARRERLKLTQEQAATRAHFRTRQQWNEIEAGRQVNIALDTLSRIALALECEPRDLIIRPPKRALAKA